MRGLVLAAGWHLVRRTGSANLNALAGSGPRMPVATTLFGFGVFSVMGLSPFKGSFSKFIVLYAAIEQGQWLVAFAGTLATIVAAVYYILVVQKICLEPAAQPVELAPAPRAPLAIAWPLTALTVLISLWPAPFLLFAARLAGFAGAEGVPQFETPWATPVLVPYVGGFAVYLIGRASARGRDVAAVLLAIATVAVVALDGGLDPASRLFALLFSGVCCLMIVYSIGYIGRAATANRYYFFAFLMAGSLIGVATAHELGNFYVFWELMTWTSYFLVIHEQTPKALRAGLVYFLMCAAGAYLMNFGILLTHAQIGSFEFAAIADKAGVVPPLAGAAIVACLFVGFAVKMGLVPLQTWLPLAHPEAPSSISGPLSGVLTKAGLLGMVKVLYVAFGASALARYAVNGLDANTVLMTLGCLTLIYGEMRALFERELKRMLAFSTIAQIGEIAAVLGIGTALASDAALLHVTNHAMMKTLLFYAAGAFILRTGGKRIEDLAGLGRAMPFTAGVYALASFAIMGLPPFSGFVSKFFMIYAAAMSGHVAIAALMLLGGIIGVIYYTRVVSFLFYYPYKGEGVREAPAAMLSQWAPSPRRFSSAASLPAGSSISSPRSATSRRCAARSPAGRAGPHRRLAGRRDHRHRRRGRRAARRPNLGGLGRAARGCDAGRGARRRDRSVRTLRSAVVLLRRADRRRRRAQHAALHRLPRRQPRQGRFFAAFTVMIAGLIGMTQAKDIFSFFAFWELMSSWALWAAICHEETAAARREGFKYFIFNCVGASFMFLGLAILRRSGNVRIRRARRGVARPPARNRRAGRRLGVPRPGDESGDAAGAHRLSDAPGARPDSGLWLHLRGAAQERPVGRAEAVRRVRRRGAVFQARRRGQRPAGHLYVISIIAAFTILYAGAMAAIQNGIKLLLIYSTVCQLGYVLLGVSLGTTLGVAGGLMHFVNHMMLKDALFLVAGAVMVRSHATTLDELGGLGRRMPFTFGVFLLSGLSLAGVPPLNGFSSKWLIYCAAFQSGHWALAVAAMIGSLFTLAAVMKFAHAAFMGTPTAQALAAKEAPVAMLIPMGALAAASVVVGLSPVCCWSRSRRSRASSACADHRLAAWAAARPRRLEPAAADGADGMFAILLLPGCASGAAPKSCAATSICPASSTSPLKRCGRARPTLRNADAVLRRALFAPERAPKREQA